jgi:virulence-associated protein VagC
MGAYETRTYRSGKAVALRLPGSFAIPAGERMAVEQDGDRITLRRIRNRARVTRNLRALLATLEAIGYPRRQAPLPRAPKAEQGALRPRRRGD